MQIIGKITNLEFSQTAFKVQDMLYFWLVGPQILGLLKTLGEQVGVREDILELKWDQLVVFTLDQLLLTNE